MSEAVKVKREIHKATPPASAKEVMEAILPRLRLPKVYYPESDGEPMAETDVHRKQMVYLIEALDDYFRHEPQVYVAGNLFVYYEEGNPAAVVAPDVFVVFGVPKGDRRIYKVWEEGKAPDVVFEITSAGTRWEDLGSKRGTYAYLGVREYFLFDPLGEYLQPVLQGWQLVEGDYRAMPPAEKEDQLCIHSRVLGLDLVVEDGFLRLYNPRTGEKLLTPLEAQEARRQAEERIAQLEQELARLRGELAQASG